MSDLVKRLRDEGKYYNAELWNEAADEIERLREALQTFRSLVSEGGVPRYTVTPGAALNSVIEEVVDPILARPR